MTPPAADAQTVEVLRPSILLCHGWALHPENLAPLADYLRRLGYTVNALDLGYYQTPNIPDYAYQEPVILLGHSFGMWTLFEAARHHAFPVHAVISLGGFTRFPLPAAQVRALRRRVQNQAAETVRDFLNRCNIAPTAAQDFTRLDVAALLRDLEILEHATTQSPAVPTLALYGQADVLLAEHYRSESSHRSAATVMREFDGRNHDLGTGDDPAVFAIIADFLHSVASPVIKATTDAAWFVHDQNSSQKNSATGFAR